MKPDIATCATTALELIYYLQTHRWVSSSMLVEDLHYHPKKAQRWLAVAARVLPLEVRERESKIEGPGTCHYYRWMKR